MKVLIIFLSLVVMGCVTAGYRNPDSEKLAYNNDPCVDGRWLSSLRDTVQSNKQENPPIMVADYATCMDYCVGDGGSDEECHCVCKRE